MRRMAREKTEGAAASCGLRRHIAVLCAILALCCLVFLWAGYTFLPDAADSSRREIVCDDYAELPPSLTAPLGEGGELRQEIEVQGRLYGVWLRLCTYNRVARGTLRLRLVDAGGNVAAACDTDMTELLDNTFHRFIFDSAANAGEGARYTLVISASPETAEDLLGFYRSEGAARDYVYEGQSAAHYPLSGFRLTESGAPQQGTLAMQYVTRYAGSFIVRAYAFFAALLTTLLLAVYALLFIFRQPPHRVFLLCAAGLGFVFMFLIPPRTAPDEYAHISTAYHYSNVLLGRAQQDTQYQIAVRAGDEMMLHNYDSTATDVFAWQDMAEGLFAPAPRGGDVTQRARVAEAFWALYIPQTLGVLAARLLGLGRVGLLLAGRLFNLLAYGFIVSRAVKRLPAAKPAMAAAGLLPMSLQLAASFSYDALVIALAFYFTALCLQYALAKETVNARQVLWLGAVAVLLAPGKTVYIAVVFLIFIIPKQRFAGPRLCVAARAGILAVSLAAWAAFGLSGAGSVTAMAPPAAQQPAAASQSVSAGVESPEAELPPPAEQSGLQPNGDAVQLYSLVYVLSHIPRTLLLLARSVWEQGALWLQGLLGGRLGEIIAIRIEMNWLFTIGLLLTLLAACLPNSEDGLVLARPRRLGMMSVALAVAALVTAASLTWTPVNYGTLFGFQGRYLLPVLPLALLALRGGSLRFTRPTQGACMFAAAALPALCQLNAFVIIAQR